MKPWRTGRTVATCTCFLLIWWSIAKEWYNLVKRHTECEFRKARKADEARYFAFHICCQVLLETASKIDGRRVSPSCGHRTHTRFLFGALLHSRCWSRQEWKIGLACWCNNLYTISVCGPGQCSPITDTPEPLSRCHVHQQDGHARVVDTIILFVFSDAVLCGREE